jgi:plastocyanin
MSSRARALALPVLAVGLSVAAGACGSSDKKSAGTAAASSNTTAASTATTGPGASAGTNIIIKDFVFKPQELTAKVGDTITVKNDDGTTHTITAIKDGGFNTGNISGGGTKTFTVAKAGTFAYHCNIHNYMTGSITVS